jgi:hypothetical protein
MARDTDPQLIIPELRDVNRGNNSGHERPKSAHQELDAKAFNRQRAEFNERVRDYAIESGEHSAFVMANYVAFKLLRPHKQHEFITDDELAGRLNMNRRTLNRLRKKLIPLGLAVILGKWKGKATEYAIGPAKRDTGDTLYDVSKRDTDVTLSSTKRDSCVHQSVTPEASKRDTGVTSLTREDTRRIQERARALARGSLSEPAFDSNLEEAKNGELLPPEDKRRQGRPTPLPPDWQPTDEDWIHAAEQGLTGGDIEHEAQRFRDWVAETAKKSGDWSATWRRFVGNSRQNKRHRRRTLAEQAWELAKEAEAREQARQAAGHPAFNPNDPVWVSKSEEPELWAALCELNGGEFPDFGAGGRQFTRWQVEQAKARGPP